MPGHGGTRLYCCPPNVPLRLWPWLAPASSALTATLEGAVSAIWSTCVHSLAAVRCRDSQEGEASKLFSLFSDWLSNLRMEEVHREEPLSSLQLVPVCERQIFLSCSLWTRPSFLQNLRHPRSLDSNCPGHSPHYCLLAFLFLIWMPPFSLTYMPFHSQNFERFFCSSTKHS